jgi:hypothetical protein
MISHVKRPQHFLRDEEGRQVTRAVATMWHYGTEQYHDRIQDHIRDSLVSLSLLHGFKVI